MTAFDPEVMRAQIERQLTSRFRLMRQRMWLLMHLAVYVVSVLLFLAQRDPAFYYVSGGVFIPGGSGYDVFSKQYVIIAARDITYYSPHSFWIFLGVVWTALIIWHVVSYAIALRRQQSIDAELDEKYRARKKHLQSTLHHVTNDAPEKAKRMVSITDDGELTDDFPEEEHPALRRSR